MDEIMEMLHDYVTTAARFTAGDELSSGERARWLALSKLIPGNGEPPSPADEDESEDGMPVQVTAPGGFEPARLLAVSRDGMRVGIARPLSVGTHTVVRVIAARDGVEYTFPCKVAWVSDDSVGLAFDGVPGRTPLSKAMLVGWRRPLDFRTGWGDKTPVGLA